MDKVAPLITATQTTAGYGQPTTVTFTCGDDLSGIASCLADGSSSSSVTVTQNGTVTGTAIDMAGNKQTHAVEVENVDTTPPTLSGAPTTEPNAAGWYRDDVTHEDFLDAWERYVPIRTGDEEDAEESGKTGEPGV